MLRKLFRQTIWHPSAIPPLERKYAVPLKRVVFPIYDIVVVLVGLLGLVAGIRAIDEALPAPGPAVLFWTLAVSGVVCFFGCTVPRWWVAEIAGKSAILISLLVVLIAMLVAAFRVDGYTGLTIAPIIVVMLLVPLLRLWILGVEIAERHLPREGASWNG